MRIRRCKWWFGVLLGISAGILIYILLPAEWLLFVMCIVIIYICITVMFT